MKIRFSNDTDFPQIKRLWNEAFGDSDKDIQFFLDGKYSTCNSLIIEENNEIASMLFLLDGNLHINDFDYPSYYLYAACTLKKFRGRGFMTCLLEYAKQIASDRGIEFICLMPGEESLFGFYKKHGYLTVFNKKVLLIDRKNIETSPVDAEYYCLNFEDLRNNAFAAFDYFKWDKNAIDFAIRHNDLYGGNLMVCRKGYCLYTENNGTITVKEFAFTEKDFESGLNLIANICESDQIILNLPSQYKTNIGSFEVVPSAMICPITQKAEAVSAEIKNAYLGLTLD